MQGNTKTKQTITRTLNRKYTRGVSDDDPDDDDDYRDDNNDKTAFLLNKLFHF